jgi:DNA polymerase-1
MKKKIITMDYSQIEIRILAHLMNDPNVIEAIKNGHDMHAATASSIFKVLLEEVTKEQRSVGKNLNFSKIYGQGITATARSLSISKEEAMEHEKKYYEAFPSIKETINLEINKCRSNGYTMTLLGHKRWLPDINSRDNYKRARAERQTFNTVIQGTAAEVARCCMIRIVEELLPKYKDLKLILQVHDEFVLEVPEDVVQLVERDLRELAEDPFLIDGERLLELRVPLTVDISIADNYGDSK